MKKDLLDRKQLRRHRLERKAKAKASKQSKRQNRRKK